MDHMNDRTAAPPLAASAPAGWRRRMIRLAAAPLLALGIIGATLLPAAPALAQAPADLDVVSCTAVDDPEDYGDGIDWYLIQFTLINRGGTEAKNWTYLARPSFGKDPFSGQIGNESYVVRSGPTLQPQQSKSTSVWVTKNVVDKRTWGIFLDNNGFNQGTIAESKESNNHCTFFANP